MNKYKIIPKDITPEMLEAADNVYCRSYTGTMTAHPADVHQAMVNAAPKLDVVVTTDDTGRCVAVTIQDDDHHIVHVLWTAEGE